MARGHNGCGTALEHLMKQIEQILRMTNRVTNRRHGMKEGDILKIVNALIISRVAYSAPFLCLTATNIKTLNAALRKAIKMALGLPQ
ncbi:hypothetical protein HPB48_010034 [Haemaphysalis longicornis]|uniref:Uncharacterized protein n=1 Tax=Haemaphysalis longicornis TaxID=44386 RepID=A0A9J6GRS7_HAELO|nr:hypothetical protein HPB48_010034 [Haemaphysalis longicornis]